MLIQEMPISEKEFKSMIKKLDKMTPCYHDDRHVQALLCHHPKKEEIIQWFHYHGGFCDCQVIMNVMNAYYFLFEKKTVKRQPKIKPKKPAPYQKITTFQTGLALSCDFPKPWQFFISNIISEQKLFGFGKKGQKSELTVIFHEKPKRALEKTDQYFCRVWQEAYPCAEVSTLDILSENIVSNMGILSLVVVKSVQWGGCSYVDI